MTRCGRLGTACLSAAIAAGGMLPSVAAAPESVGVTTADAGDRAAAAMFARPDASRPVVTPNSPGTAYVRSAPAQSFDPGTPEPVYVRPKAAGWIALAGAFQRQGSYELSGDSITLGDLVDRCGGLEDEASGRLRLVRSGQPSGLVEHDDLRLRPGDLLIAEREVDPTSPSAQDRIDCELAILGLTDRPLVVRVPAAFATVEGMLQLTGQTHLNPGDVKVLIAGQRAAAGHQVGQLPETSVIVFDPLQVNAEAVANHPPRTNYYPATGASNSRPVASTEPRATITRVAATNDDTVSNAGPTANPVANGSMPVRVDSGPSVEIALAPPTANAAPSVEDSLAPLPPEMLDPPPGEPELRFPRVADSSGAIPIGQPEADSHIVPLPDDVFYPVDPVPGSEAADTELPQTTANDAASTESAATVAPIDLTDSDAANDADETPFEDLLPILVVGALLGGATYLTLRWLRGRKLSHTMSHAVIEHSRMPKQPAATGHTATSGTATGDTMAGSTPADTLADTLQLRLLNPEPCPIPPGPSEPASAEPDPIEATTLDPPVAAATPVADTTSKSSKSAASSAGSLLAALIADRLVRREETVALPLSLQLHGRSSALQKQRLDGTAPSIPEPHLSLATACETRNTSQPGGEAASESPHTNAGDPSPDDARRRIDPPLAAAAALTSGTPFERALAARHRAQHRGET